LNWLTLPEIVSFSLLHLLHRILCSTNRRLGLQNDKSVPTCILSNILALNTFKSIFNMQQIAFVILNFTMVYSRQIGFIQNQLQLDLKNITSLHIALIVIHIRVPIIIIRWINTMMSDQPPPQKAVDCISMHIDRYLAIDTNGLRNVNQSKTPLWYQENIYVKLSSVERIRSGIVRWILVNIWEWHCRCCWRLHISSLYVLVITESNEGSEGYSRNVATFFLSVSFVCIGLI